MAKQCFKKKTQDFYPHSFGRHKPLTTSQSGSPRETITPKYKASQLYMWIKISRTSGGGLYVWGGLGLYGKENQVITNFLRRFAPVSHKNSSNFRRNCPHFRIFAQKIDFKMLSSPLHLKFSLGFIMCVCLLRQYSGRGLYI